MPLVRDAVMELFDYVGDRYGKDAEVALLEQLPWTEFALYFTFLETQNRFDLYHIPSGRLRGNTINDASQISTWDPAKSFNAKAPPFSTLHSTKVKSVDEIVEKIRAFFAASGQPSPV